MQERCNSIAKALELQFSGTKPLIRQSVQWTLCINVGEMSPSAFLSHLVYIDGEILIAATAGWILIGFLMGNCNVITEIRRLSHVWHL